MKKLLKEEKLIYVQFEDPGEFESYRIRAAEKEEEGFEFYRGLGIIGYARTFKMWMRRFPRPIFIAAINDREIVSWVFVEDWGEPAKDGLPVFVLRAIETLPKLRGRRIGYKVLVLALAQIAGYLITKPLTKKSEMFFKRVGFMEEREFERAPVDLAGHTGYLILPPHKRKKVVEEARRYMGEALVGL